jgi:hypothetical protein
VSFSNQDPERFLRPRDKRVVVRSTGADDRRPLEDGYDDHPQNCALDISPTLGLGTGLEAVTTDPS